MGNWSDTFGHKMVYKGVWDASTNVFPVNPKFGYMYRVSVTGVVGLITYYVDEFINYTETGWIKVGAAEPALAVSEIWTVGPTGDYPNFVDAINDFFTVPTNKNVTITITTEPGYTFTSADQYEFISIDAPNLILDTDGICDVDFASSPAFVSHPFGVTSLFSLSNSRIGKIVGEYNQTNPPPSGPSAFVALINSSFTWSEYPNMAGVLSVTGFDYFTYSIEGDINAVFGTTDSALRFDNCDNTTLYGTTITKTGGSVFVVTSSDVNLGLVTVTATGSNGSVFELNAGANIDAAAGGFGPATFNVGKKLISSNASTVVLQNCIIDVDIVALEATASPILIDVGNSSDIKIVNPTFGITGTPTATATFINMNDHTSVVTFDSLAITAADWLSVCNVPIGQTFATGGGVFGLTVDGSSSGLFGGVLSEAGTLTRPLYSSYVTLIGTPVNEYTVNLSTANIPVGASIFVYALSDINVLHTDIAFLAITDILHVKAGELIEFRFTEVFDGFDTGIVITRTTPNGSARIDNLRVPKNVTSPYTITWNDWNAELIFNEATDCSLIFPDTTSFIENFPKGFTINARNRDVGKITLSSPTATLHGVSPVVRNNNVLKCFVEENTLGAERIVIDSVDTTDYQGPTFVYSVDDFPAPTLGSPPNIIVLDGAYVLKNDVDIGTNQLTFGTNGSLTSFGVNDETQKFKLQFTQGFSYPIGDPLIVGSLLTDFSISNIIFYANTGGVIFDIEMATGSILTLRNVELWGGYGSGQLRGGTLDIDNYICYDITGTTVSNVYMFFTDAFDQIKINNLTTNCDYGSGDGALWFGHTYFTPGSPPYIVTTTYPIVISNSKFLGPSDIACRVHGTHGLTTKQLQFHNCFFESNTNANGFDNGFTTYSTFVYASHNVGIINGIPERTGISINNNLGNFLNPTSGIDESMAIGDNANASSYALAVGRIATASGNGIAIGRSSNAGNQGASAGSIVIGAGSNTSTWGACVAIGGITSVYGIAIGAETNGSNGEHNIVVGTGATTGSNSRRNTIIGFGAYDNNTNNAGNNVVIGYYAHSSSYNASVVIGNQASCNYTSSQAVIIGSGSQGSGISIGANANSNNGGISIGNSTNHAHGNDVTIGHYCTSTGGGNAVTIGVFTTSTQNSICIGSGSSNTAEYATVFGMNSSNNAQRSVAIGSSITVTHVNSVVIGNTSSSYNASEFKFTSSINNTSTNTCVLNATTSGIPPQYFNTDGSTFFYQIPDNRVANIRLEVVAMRNNPYGEVAAWEASYTLLKRIGGVYSIVSSDIDTTPITPDKFDAGAATWTIQASVDSVNGLQIQVVGEAAKNIVWNAKITNTQYYS